MSNALKRKIERLIYILNGKDKEFAEIKFWRKQIALYVEWYQGTISNLYGHPTPTDTEKVQAATLDLSAILTFFNIHQQEKYRRDLQLGAQELSGQKVLDIGSGPFPSGLVFEGCEIYSLDPLHGHYIEAGYPLHCYEQRARFVCSQAESMPFTDGFFDAVISVNAIDHVNDFAATAREIRRVLKPGGRFRMHVHYHPETKAEPIELNDAIFQEHYGWVSGLRRIHESKVKTGTAISDDRELYVLWGN